MPISSVRLAARTLSLAALATVLPGFTLVDPAVALDQGDKWRRSFEEVILKQGGRQ